MIHPTDVAIRSTVVRPAGKQADTATGGARSPAAAAPARRT